MSAAVLALALTILVEARGEPLRGKMAVATVLHNEKEAHPEKDWKTIATNPNRYSCWRDSELMKAVGEEEADEDSEWWDCVNLAQQLVHGDFKPLGPWTHYFNPEKADPFWGPMLKDQEQISHHLFGRLEE